MHLSPLSLPSLMDGCIVTGGPLDHATNAPLKGGKHTLCVAVLPCWNVAETWPHHMRAVTDGMAAFVLLHLYIHPSFRLHGAELSGMALCIRLIGFRLGSSDWQASQLLSQSVRGH